MSHTPPSFPLALLSAVLGTVLLVMTVAFISVPLSIGAHPGEAAAGPKPAFHPT